MCLMECYPATPEQQSGTGYKVMNMNVDAAEQQYFKSLDVIHHVSYPAQQWIKNQIRLKLNLHLKHEYDSGFHIFINLEDAIKYREEHLLAIIPPHSKLDETTYIKKPVIVKVKYQNANTKGTLGILSFPCGFQCGYIFDCVVAQDMLIEAIYDPNTKEWTNLTPTQNSAEIDRNSA